MHINPGVEVSYVKNTLLLMIQSMQNALLL